MTSDMSCILLSWSLFPTFPPSYHQGRLVGGLLACPGKSPQGKVNTPSTSELSLIKVFIRAGNKHMFSA